MVYGDINDMSWYRHNVHNIDIFMKFIMSFEAKKSVWLNTHNLIHDSQ